MIAFPADWQVMAFPAAGLQIILNFIDVAVTGGGRESG